MNIQKLKRTVNDSLTKSTGETYNLSAFVSHKVIIINTEKRLRFPLAYQKIVTFTACGEIDSISWRFPLEWIGFWKIIRTQSEDTESVRVSKQVDEAAANRIMGLKTYDEKGLAIALELDIVKLSFAELVRNQPSEYIKTTCVKINKPNEVNQFISV